MQALQRVWQFLTSPPCKALLAMGVMGLGMLFLVGMNLKQMADQRRRNGTPNNLPVPTAAKFSWWVSLVSVWIPYLLPISLVAAGVAYLLTRRQGTMAASRHAIVMSLINCGCAALVVLWLWWAVLPSLRQ